MNDQSPWTESTYGSGYPSPVPGPVAPAPAEQYGKYRPGQYVTQPERAPALSGLAVASMILGIVWLFWLGSLLAVIFGHIALRQTRNGQQTGRGFAIAGVALGWTGLGFFGLSIFINLLTWAGM